MPRLSDLSHRYQNLRAHHGYNYPALFIAAGAAKTLAQAGLVAGIAWYGVTLLTQPVVPVTEARTVQNTFAAPVSTEISTTADTGTQIEIPAASLPELQTTNVKATVPEAALITPRKENKLLGADWLLKQDASAFTIQFGSSPDKELLYRSAKTFESEFSVVVFPFKRTPSNRPVYGFSSGIYESLDDARQGILALPESAFTYGPWVRPVGKLQKQIKQMSE